ncbi:inorganic diphosphatase [Candidatus Annandia pinicola]|uniref:inorganic diphosphatase n=1 Tax=Candidatus Annandia pinicola TaxID=1345117 RepID=UPI001D02A871|nr:inorganic diphosphatase [Candidatus Annandia pinicola]UDG80255.1 Inorganic pyrophosphatase [Candidatus Annandia pinicola]
MNINNIPSGIKIPEELYVIIEISSYSTPIKYEIDKKTGMLFVDRFIPTSMFYPCNYGYINNTLSLDGDPLDALVITPFSLKSRSVILTKPVGMINLIDEKGEDNKIITVPHNKISNEYDNINNINDISLKLRNQILHFFEHYKDLEKEKWIKFKGWSNSKDSKIEIIKSCDRFKKNKNLL